MKVLHVIPSVAPRDGGPSQVIAPMCSALRAAGIDVTIAATDADGAGALDVRLDVATEWQGVRARFFHRDFTESFKYSRSLAAWLHAHAREFDVVHAHAVLSHAPLAAAAACRRAGVPYVVRPLGTVASWSLGRKAWRKRLLVAVAARRMLAGAAAVHCTSRGERDDLEATFGLTNGRVIPLGLDVARLAAGADDLAARSGNRYVLALSRLDPKKNFEGLIDAFVEARLHTAEPFDLIIAGSGDAAYTSALERRVRERGAAACIHFAGWVDGGAKRTLIARASLFALPSRHENFGMAVLEALSASVPVLVSRDVQLAEEVERADAGWVVDGSHAMLVQALTGSMADAPARERRGLCARQLSLRFAWPAVAAQMVDMYRDVTAGARR